jgi:hypothetical protein
MPVTNTEAGVCFEKLIIAQLVKKLLAFKIIQRFITVFPSVWHLTLYLAR